MCAFLLFFLNKYIIIYFEMNNNALKYAKNIYLSRILTKPVYMHYANNVKATQLMHLCGPISAFCYSQSFNDIL